MKERESAESTRVRGSGIELEEIVGRGRETRRKLENQEEKRNCWKRR